MNPFPRILAATFLALSLGIGVPATAAACALDNTGSLLANSAGDQKNLDSAPDSPGYVPFVFPRVYGSGQTIRFAENFADLRKSLSSPELARPFLWTWGDGAHSTSYTPRHVYATPGTYVINVYAAIPSDTGTWSPFDKVRIRVVPPGEVWRDNLGQDFLDFLNVAVIWGGRGVLGVIVAGLALAFSSDYLRRRKRGLSRSGTQQRDTHAGVES